MLLNPTVLPSDQYDLTKILWGWAQIVRGEAEYDLGSSKEYFGNILGAIHKWRHPNLGLSRPPPSP